MAPTPITTSVERPSFFAHSAQSVPAASAAVYTFEYNRLVAPESNGSRLTKKSSGGRPPQSDDQSALCPAAQTPRFKSWILFPPVRRKGTQSQCSTQL